VQQNERIARQLPSYDVRKLVGESGGEDAADTSVARAFGAMLDMLDGILKAIV
jgi:hypothetical protein